MTLREQIDALRRRAIISALRVTSGNRSLAAHYLGVSVPTLYRMTERLGVKVERRTIIADDEPLAEEVEFVAFPRVHRIARESLSDGLVCHAFDRPRMVRVVNVDFTREIVSYRLGYQTKRAGITKFLEHYGVEGACEGKSALFSLEVV